MKATLHGDVIADSDDTIECGGYHYFPRASVFTQLLEKSPRTGADLACPHGVQFYDIVIDGGRHARASWSYESPRPSMAKVGGRFGFWRDVKVG